jgi:hypothetical protein
VWEGGKWLGYITASSKAKGAGRGEEKEGEDRDNRHLSEFVPHDGQVCVLVKVLVLALIFVMISFADLSLVLSLLFPSNFCSCYRC